MPCPGEVPGAGTIVFPRRGRSWSPLGLAAALRERLQQPSELQREDPLRRGAFGHALQRLEVLQGQGVVVDRLGDGEDSLQRRRVTLRSQQLRLPLTFGDPDRRLLLPL